MNFKKYISDFSLINERPPESVKIWGKYLVYASALGCADEATSTMKKYYDLVEISDSIDSSDVLSFAYYGGFDNMESSFYSLDVSVQTLPEYQMALEEDLVEVEVEHFKFPPNLKNSFFKSLIVRLVFCFKY